jgi:hypothetical protein
MTDFDFPLVKFVLDPVRLLRYFVSPSNRPAFLSFDRERFQASTALIPTHATHFDQRTPSSTRFSGALAIVLAGVSVSI